jgi:WD40 repeat protein
MGVSKKHGIILWKRDGTVAPKTIRGHNAMIDQLAFSRDGSKLVSSGHHGVVRVWDVHSGSRLAQLNPNRRAPVQANFTPDGSAIAIGSSPGFLGVWRYQSEDDVRRFENASLKVQGPMWFVGDGARLLAVDGRKYKDSRPGSIKLWDVKTGKLDRTFDGHFCSYRSLAILPDGVHFVSAGADKTIRLWSTASPREMTRGVAANDVSKVVVSADGRVALTAGQEGDDVITVWRLPKIP